MSMLNDLIQCAAWKTGKHVPVIKCPTQVDVGKPFKVKAALGNTAAHPNTAEHHIRWIRLFFHGKGAEQPFKVGDFEFPKNGNNSREASDCARYEGLVSVEISAPGTLYALAYCNVHGVWQTSKEIFV